MRDDGQLLGGQPHLSSRQVAAQAGVSLRSARKFWRALGFANVDEAAPAFTDADVQALHRVSGLVREGVVDEPTALAITRAIGRSVDRLTSWQIQLVAEAVAEQLAADGELAPGEEPSAGGASSDVGEVLADRVAVLVADLSDRLEPLVTYAWRRHLWSSMERFTAERRPQPDGPAMQRTVGFADLVSFTRVVSAMTERELAVLVQRFEATASDIIASHGGRVVKTVGDEVMFVAQRAPAAAAIGLDIAHEMGKDELLPDVRVGLATGAVVARLGDLFGTTVNRASRLTSIAAPGAVLADDATAGALGESSGFGANAMRRRPLKGLGVVTPWVLKRRADRG